MELEEAKKILDIKIWDLMNGACGECIIENNERDSYQEAIKTVLEELKNSVSKDKIKEIINKYSYINKDGSSTMPFTCYELFFEDIISLVGYKIKEDN